MDKEQIIIDGVLFDESGDFYVDYNLNGRFQNVSSFAKEYIILKHLIEQLIHKTQECEELKAYAQRQENQREEYYKEYLKKDKALEEIEEYVRNNSDFDKSDTLISKTGAYDILDIINKAKGEE